MIRYCLITLICSVLFISNGNSENITEDKKTAESKILKVAAVPMFGIRPIDESCLYIINKIHVAGKLGVDVVVFPETATNSYQSEHYSGHPIDLAVWNEIQLWIPKIQQAVKEEQNLWVIVGTFRFVDSKLYNSALIIDPDGEIRAIYDKMTEGGTKWLMMEIKGILCTTAICFDIWVPGMFTIPKMLGAQVMFFPHGSGAVREDRRDFHSVYFTRVWETDMFLVMADCSWQVGTFTRPTAVSYPYDYTYHLLNQSCIIEPGNPPVFLARATRDEQDGLLIANIDISKIGQWQRDPTRFPVISQQWKDMLKYYEEHGYIEWMK